jgi:hypothetical protein
MDSARVLVLVPVDRAFAERLIRQSAVAGPLVAFTANEALCETFGLADADADQAEFATLQVAQVAALCGYGRRLVLTAKVLPTTLVDRDATEADNGRVRLGELALDTVEAFFVPDDPVGDAAAARVARGLSVDAAWALPEVAALLADAPLAWHDITELPQWLAE